MENFQRVVKKTGSIVYAYKEYQKTWLKFTFECFLWFILSLIPLINIIIFLIFVCKIFYRIFNINTVVYKEKYEKFFKYVESV